MPHPAMTQEAFMKEALRYQSALVAYAYARLRDYHLADDVVQDALIVLMDKWSTFTPGSSVFAFARQVVQYKVLEAHRRRTTHELPMEEAQLAAVVDRTLAEGIDEETASRQNELVHALTDCLGRLNRKALALLDGFYRDSKSYAELSVQHAQSLEAVKKALYRYRRILQDCAERRRSGSVA